MIDHRLGKLPLFCLTRQDGGAPHRRKTDRNFQFEHEQDVCNFISLPTTTVQKQKGLHFVIKTEKKLAVNKGK